MKKYLMTGVAAIAFAATFTSCSKAGDLYDEGKVEQQKEATVNEKYAAAFEKAFGKVGSNVDWGFSSRTSSARALTRVYGDYDRYKGSLEPSFPSWSTFSFPSDAPASCFNPDITGVLSYDDCCKTQPNASQWWTPDELVSGVVYIDKVQKVKITGANSGSKLYIKAGTYDFSETEFNLAEGTEVYLLPGVTLTLNNTAASTAKFILYIASTSRLIANGADGLKMDNTGKVYNHGEIECSRFEVNSNCFLYNVGSFNCSGLIYVANSNTAIVNDGTVVGNEVKIQGSGNVQNNAEWTVNGNTIVDSNNASWVNNGNWTTTNYYYTAGSENVINNCYLEVTNEFNINTSSNSAYSFKIDSGGGVLTTYFNGGKAGNDPNSKSGPYKVIMGHASVFKVTETATLEGGNPGWGFFGPTDGEYAVFQAKDVVRASGLENTQGAVTYGGNLYVSAETHFAQGHDGQDSEGHYFINERGGFSVNTNIYAEGFKPGKPSVKIQQTPCNPGFGGSDPLKRVIAEDLSATEAGDFDFNDVVFDVVKYEGGKTTLRLQACGGTLPLKIGSTNGVGGVEVHSLYGDTEPDATTGKYKMWNTGAGNSHDPYDFEIDGQYTTPEQLLNLRIEVQKEGAWMLLDAKRGVAACKILVDDRFGIVPERQSIANKYGNFTTYVQGHWNDSEGHEEQFWWIQTK